MPQGEVGYPAGVSTCVAGNGGVKTLWWFCRGCSPLPIPNREVKPLMADGTAPQCGRVGSCHIYLASSFLMRLFYFRLLIADSAWSTMTINSLVVLRPYV